MFSQPRVAACACVVAVCIALALRAWPEYNTVVIPVHEDGDGAHCGISTRRGRRAKVLFPHPPLFIYCTDKRIRLLGFTPYHGLNIVRLEESVRHQQYPPLSRKYIRQYMAGHTAYCFR